MMCAFCGLSPDGGTREVFPGKAAAWGDFLRYKYVQLDFTKVVEPGNLPVVGISRQRLRTPAFRISRAMYLQRHVWQPVPWNTFLPVQMCHMRVKRATTAFGMERCHVDDALHGRRLRTITSTAMSREPQH